MENLYRSKPEGSYDLKDMRAKGFGSRLTVKRKVERGELPRPFKMGNAQNSQWFWKICPVLHFVDKSLFDKHIRMVNPTQTYKTLHQPDKDHAQSCKAL